MFKIPFYEGYRKNSQRCTGEEQPCIICGRPVKKPIKMVHVHKGGTHIVTDEEAAKMDEAGDMGAYPVGPECLRNHPEVKTYVQRSYDHECTRD